MKLPSRWFEAFVGDELNLLPKEKTQPKCLLCYHSKHFGLFTKGGCNGLPLPGKYTGCDKYENGKETMLSLGYLHEEEQD